MRLRDGCRARAGLRPDFLLGNSKGYSLARKLDIPLIRVGFPIHDRIGAQRLHTLGYRGTQELFDRIVNALLERKQEKSDVGYSYLYHKCGWRRTQVRASSRARAAARGLRLRRSSRKETRALLRDAQLAAHACDDRRGAHAFHIAAPQPGSARVRARDFRGRGDNASRLDESSAAAALRFARRARRARRDRREAPACHATRREPASNVRPALERRARACVHSRPRADGASSRYGRDARRRPCRALRGHSAPRRFLRGGSRGPRLARRAWRVDRRVELGLREQNPALWRVVAISTGVILAALGGAALWALSA